MATRKKKLEIMGKEYVFLMHLEPGQAGFGLDVIPVSNSDKQMTLNEIATCLEEFVNDNILNDYEPTTDEMN